MNRQVIFVHSLTHVEVSGVHQGDISRNGPLSPPRHSPRNCQAICLCKESNQLSPSPPARLVSVEDPPWRAFRVPLPAPSTRRGAAVTTNYLPVFALDQLRRLHWYMLNPVITRMFDGKIKRRLFPLTGAVFVQPRRAVRKACAHLVDTGERVHAEQMRSL
ncbi:hypothetical protein NDU88_007059 [Pleurodeles waltl]|uniref:Uncharacterized protein n=1 Tax=Pleurodeles waltl TaxID=8319 RepID=A0AAV7MLV2_PLEWA|nr:hypothetical protein NDU88_007059 [Pleurodeles waltl]